jgi:flagellar motility protein MotE (MotC chaperone)
MKQIRLLPLLLTAISGLLILKLAGLWLGIGPEVQGVVSAYAQTEPAQEEAGQSAAPEEAPEEAVAAVATEDPPLETNPDGVGEIVANEESMSPARIAILQRLAQRRRALDEYQRELELRENLLDATEIRLQEKLAELRAVEERIQTAIGARDEEQQAQLQGLVVMYENMKPKDAARIFDRLEMPVLIELVQQMNARKMAEILAKMTSETAEALTVEISRLGRQDAVPMPVSADGELPRIGSAN